MMVCCILLSVNLLPVNVMASSVDAKAKAPIRLSGGGSTNLQPLMSSWIQRYKKLDVSKAGYSLDVNYTSVGSGLGMSMLEKGTVDFSASEVPLCQCKLEAKQLLQFPVAIAPVEIIYNLPKLDCQSIILTGEVIAKIYLSEITMWNDPAIAALNPGVRLPSHDIEIIYRSGESGTTYALSTYLGQVSTVWADKYQVASKCKCKGKGNGECKCKGKCKCGSRSTSLDLKVKNSMGVDSNRAVAQIVRSTPYSIGYVDYAYATSENLSMASMINASGYLVRPNLLTAYAAVLSGVSRNMDYEEIDNLSNLQGSNVWPIMMATYVVMPKDQSHIVQKLSFFLWCMTHGNPFANDLNYIPTPWGQVNQIVEFWDAACLHGFSKKLLWGLVKDKMVVYYNNRV